MINKFLHSTFYILHSVLTAALVVIFSVSSILFFGQIAYAQEGYKKENVKVFGSEPMAGETDEGRNLLTCFEHWRDFLAAGIGFEDFSDYWRDFFLWPSHFADVMNVQNQLNKARYSVMAAFLRCDLDKLKSVTEAYYRLEAELYFVRHFVDTSGGFLRVLTESEGQRDRFAEEMLDYMILLKPAENKDKERALYKGYFDLFAAKYAGRAKQYKSFEDDEIYAELYAKFLEFQSAINDFEKLGSEMEELGKEAIIEPAKAIGKAATAFYNNPLKALKEAGKSILNRFDACVATKDNRRCATGKSRVGAPENVFGDTPGFTKTSEKKTFDQVMSGIKQQEQKKTEDIDEAQMLARYEMLYGQASGDGMKALADKMQEMIDILGKSSSPLNELENCADHVSGEVCRN
ncbi:hypothetical protein HZC21_01465 [Candidatus Peregrinibacteria bacterium]|nr:hypothetical protein [Candidatus Peregrinibacteria bacterium]